MSKKPVVHLAVAMLVATLPTFAIGSVSNDQVLSQHIREAVPGSVDQNTNSGSGVKTNHIVDQAVSSNKIKDQAVTTSKVADGAVTSSKIEDGAVTDAKISGLISTSKLDVGTAAGTVAAGDHTHEGNYQKKLANLIIVAKEGGDFTSPIDAVNSITDASAEKPYLVKVMPGVYDLGYSRINMKSFVSLEGSGADSTKIVSMSTGGSYQFNGCVISMDSVSNISVSKVAFANRVNGITRLVVCTMNASNITLDNIAVTVEADNYGNNRSTFNTGISMWNETNTVIKNSKIDMRSAGTIAGIIGTKGTIVENTTITVESVPDGTSTTVSGIFSNGADTKFAKVRNSIISAANGSAATAAVYIRDAQSTVEVANSELSSTGGAFVITDTVLGTTKLLLNNNKITGTVPAGIGTLGCLNNYTADYQPFICQ